MRTKQEVVKDAVERWQELGLPDPTTTPRLQFVNALIETGVLPEGQAVPSAARMVRMALEGDVATEEPEAPEGTSLVRQHARHIYDGETYLFFPPKKAPFRVAAGIVQEWKRAYSHKKDGGLGWTINQVCRHWRVGRPEFMFVRAELGWTKDQDEFTGEEHLELTTRQLLDDREQRSRWMLERAQRDQEVAELRRLAALGTSFERQQEALEQALAGLVATRPPASTFSSAADRCVVLPLADLHDGAPRSDGMRQSVMRLVGRLPKGVPVMPVWLGDFFHYDTYAKTTTRGTPQDGARVEPADMLAEAYRFGFGVMEALRRSHPLLETIVVPGNHDHMATLHWQLALKAAGYCVDDQGGEGLKYAMWGRDLFVFEHGDGGRGKTENYLLAALDRRRDLVGQTDRTWVWTGHLHHVKQMDVGGAVHFQLPSPSKGSRWEKKQAYVSRHGLQAFEFGPDGLLRTHWEWA